MKKRLLDVRRKSNVLVAPRDKVVEDDVQIRIFEYNQRVAFATSCLEHFGVRRAGPVDAICGAILPFISDMISERASGMLDRAKIATLKKSMKGYFGIDADNLKVSDLHSLVCWKSPEKRAVLAGDLDQVHENIVEYISELISDVDAFPDECLDHNIDLEAYPEWTQLKLSLNDLMARAIEISGKPKKVIPDGLINLVVANCGNKLLEN